MRQLYIEYDERFEMERAIHDRYRLFFNAYRRSVDGSGQPELRRSQGVGAVERARESVYIEKYPARHIHGGQLMLSSGSMEMQARGRYTFGGYDFSIVSTVNSDPYGTLALKYMSLPPTSIDPAFLPKVGRSAFNVRPLHDTVSHQLVIDHVHRRVMVLGVARQKESDVTADGVDLNYVERPECLPATVTERDSCRAFSAHWTQPLKPMRSMELTLPRTPKNLPKDYQRIVDGCVAWLALCGKTEDQIVAECRKTTPIPNLNTPLDPQFISNQGFTGLSPVQKLIVATVNGHPDKKLPRYVQKFYYLHFDNKGFFDEFEETIKQSVPRPVEV